MLFKTLFSLIAIIGFAFCAPLPQYANIVKGVDRLGNPYSLFSSTLLLNFNDLGAWLTEIEPVDNNNGTWTFTTKLFKKPKNEVTVTIHGDFSAQIENELLFVIEPGYWHEYVELDNAIADIVNSRLERLDNIGQLIENTNTTVPYLDDSIDKLTFLFLYSSTNDNAPLQSNLLLQAVVFSAVQRFDFANPLIAERAQALYEEVITLFLLRKFNLFNIWRQKMLAPIF